MSNQPEALRLADAIFHEAASAELHRLHQVELQRDELLAALKLCEGNISSLLASKHPKVFGAWLDVVRAAINKVKGQS